MANLGLFRAFLSPRGCGIRPKKANDAFSPNGICKFEFGTIKNHYKDIHKNILDKHQKKPPKGVFLALKAPEVHEPEIFRGQQ